MQLSEYNVDFKIKQKTENKYYIIINLLFNCYLFLIINLLKLFKRIIFYFNKIRSFNEEVFLIIHKINNKLYNTI
jgi:hypothetical protein